MTSPENMRCGFVALVGAPNAGKSTLMNRLVGAKLSIVTPKVQTTRSRITGIAIEGDAQLVFVDTPGIFEPKRRLDRAMVTAAWAGVADADAVVLLVDAGRAVKAQGHLDPDTARIVEGFKRDNRSAILALNKIDTVERGDLLTLTEALNKLYPFSETFMLSALTGDGIVDLRQRLAALVPQGPWLYPEDQLSDIPLRLLAAEITREQAFLQLHQELPYALTVETENWEERKDGSVKVDQVVIIGRENHKAMVLGKGGARLKAIGTAARKSLTDQLGRTVHLFLHVKVRENWQDKPEHYSAIGLDFEE
ncbi:MAG TPA: GTPase Era [Alphaproteobacteria bacterium]|nr:GTPase Era [Alphaproteobacteria bacterium]